MSAHTHSIPLVPAKSQVSRKQERRLRRARDLRDLELLQRVGRGDEEATLALTERIAPRVSRLSRALMGGSLDADDAALHALVELLRSNASYKGKEPLERWADRTAALAVLRFARAVSRRGSPVATGEGRASRSADERNARTFEQYLQTLTDCSRQTLLLRHALGFSMTELADALQCSAVSAKQSLLEARAELRGMVRRRASVPPAVLSPAAERWCSLRDREAQGEALRAEEQDELVQLEAREPEVWAFVAQVRALELYLESPRNEASAVLSGRTLVARAIAALRMTLLVPPPAEQGEASPRPARNLEGSRAVRLVAIGSSIGLALATAGALFFYSPHHVADVSSNAAPSAAASRELVAGRANTLPALQLRPTVEALPKVIISEGGAKLRRDGRMLVPGMQLGQGDVVEASERNGCVTIEPDTDVCLALGSAMRLGSLSARERRLELLRGRVVARVGPKSEATRVTLQAGALSASAGRAVFALERSADGNTTRARTLRGPVDVQVAEQSRQLSERESALVRASGQLELTPTLITAVQRDWEVLATGLHPPAPRVTPSPAISAPQASMDTMPSDVPTSLSAPEGSAKEQTNEVEPALQAEEPSGATDPMP